jgi:EAL domain-containing protein (putative c-di-GMP-specific phosphodiesterase class I)
VGFEALLRWRRRGREIVYPDTFIGVAEDKGLISEIGNWALRKACSTLRELTSKRPQASALFMSVNVSTRQFLDPEFPDLVWEIIQDTNIDPSTLVLELTESAAIINPAQTAQILERLRKWNIRIGLDDFGTGYSSLSHLQNLSFDAIKIDKSFVMTQTEDNANWSIVNAILGLASAMNLSVVAEGIESRFQLDRLKSIGCSLGQGYLFSRPMAEKAILPYLSAAT